MHDVEQLAVLTHLDAMLRDPIGPGDIDVLLAGVGLSMLRSLPIPVVGTICRLLGPKQPRRQPGSDDTWDHWVIPGLRRTRLVLERPPAASSSWSGPRG